MSLDGEHPPEVEGDEIRTIGYESAAEVTVQENADQNRERPIEAREGRDGTRKSSKDVEKKSKHHGAARTSGSSSSSSGYDICRICHMGNSVSSIAIAESGNRASSATPNPGTLISACRCRGTVGLVHAKCLERWLTESGHTRCELCGYRYATVRVPRHGLFRSFFVWMRMFVATRQVYPITLHFVLHTLHFVYMLLDSLYLVVTTPLAVFSAYVCAMALKMAMENRIGEIPLTIVAMLPTCSLTLVAYWGWLLTLQRLHGRRWRQYWQSNFIVRLLPDSPIVDNQSSEDLDVFYDAYEDLPEFLNLT